MILHGDCREVMATLEANSIDAIVSDPPYGLSFMGKGWDHGVPGVEFWVEALRVAKPGAHLLAFGGTRTYHRLACAIEDAGWEVRDCIAWVYGSGFPKSHDVSKAIDREAGETGGLGPMKRGGERLKRLVDGKRDGEGRWGDESGRNPFTYAPATDAAKQWSGWGTALKPAYEPIIVARKPLVGTVASNVMQYGTGGINVDKCRVFNFDTQRPNVNLAEWEQEKNLCDLCAKHAEQTEKQEIQETKVFFATKNVEPILKEKANYSQDDTNKMDTGCYVGQSKEEAKKVQLDAFSLNIEDYGKVNLEPYQSDMKSIISTEINQTIELKTCNVCQKQYTGNFIKKNTIQTKSANQNTPNEQGKDGPLGRWPSNFIHDGSDEVVGLFPETKSNVLAKHHKVKGSGGASGFLESMKRDGFDKDYGGDSGSAARFYYCAKASKADRDAGLEGFETGSRRMFASGGRTMIDGEWIELDSEPKPRKNVHPTVKPTDLMRYLCRLVTPPGGTVLDPFCGSGSTGKGAILEGFNFIGIEREAEYVEIAKARTEWASKQRQPTLFD